MRLPNIPGSGDFDMRIKTILLSSSEEESARIFSEFNDEFEIVKYTNEIPLDSFETRITTNSIPEWINKFDYQENLNKAIEALESLEMLYSEYTSLVEKEINLLFIKNEFRETHRGRNSDDFNKIFDGQNGLQNDLNLDEYRESLLIRIKHKEVDLIEYTKAAKFGFLHFFQYSVNFGEQLLDSTLSRVISNDFDKTTRIRESLRKLVLKQRLITVNEEEVFVPVSLKTSKNDENRYISNFAKSKLDKPDWGELPNIQNISDSKKGYDVGYEIDLEKYSHLTTHDLGGFKHRIARIGFNVVDRSARIVLPNVSKNDELGDVRGLNALSYQLKLEANPGIEIIDSSTSEKLIPVYAGNIVGSNRFDKLTWVRPNSLINLPANRKWKLFMTCPTQPLFPDGTLGQIYDIHLVFHIKYLTHAINS